MRSSASSKPPQPERHPSEEESHRDTTNAQRPPPVPPADGEHVERAEQGLHRAKIPRGAGSQPSTLQLGIETPNTD